MLFYYSGEFVEVLREKCYEHVLTICSNSLETIQAISNQAGTMGEPVQLHNQTHEWAIHIPDNRSIELTKGILWRDIEEVDCLTGPAPAFAYDFLPLSESEKTEGTRWGDYGYCWPEEVDTTRDRLENGEDPADDVVAFIPIWHLPAELTGAPSQWADIDGDFDEEL